MTHGEQPRRSEPLLLVAELCTMAVTLAAVVGFDRTFADSDWVRPLIISGIAAHAVFVVARRLSLGLISSAVIGVVGLALDITWTHYRSTTTAWLPTRTTADALDADLEQAWTLFADVKAPTPSVTGFVVLATIAIWVIAYLADWAAFRLWSPLEAVLPSFSMFVFIAFFGIEERRLALAALYVGALVAFQLVHRITRQEREMRWLAGSRAAGISSLAMTGAGLSAVVVLAATLVGPILPGADDSPIIDLDNSGSGQSSRVIPSPIADIRGRLIDLPDIEAFAVRSNRPSYWRVATLDKFDGQRWGTEEWPYKSVLQGLDTEIPAGVETLRIEQSFEIKAMGNLWLPGAPEPIGVRSGPSASQIGYEPVSGTLVASSDVDAIEGMTYELVSQSPVYDPSSLQSEAAPMPESITTRYRGLPLDFSPAARELAEQLTADANTVYDKSLALQDYFQAEFVYDLNVGPGNSSDRIDEFLASGRGYCEQFAGSFAAMARSIGIPARVAVGFTPGEVDPDDPDLYHVSGKHAHAWPEVFIPGSGWVLFEPTPSRGAPGAEGWTFLPPRQAGDDAGAADPEPAGTLEPPLEDPLNGLDDEFPFDPESISGTPGSGSPSDQGGGSSSLRVLGIAFLVAATALCVYAAAVIGAKRWRARRRVSKAAGNRETLGAIWTNTLDALEPLGLIPGRAETVSEFTDRAAPIAGPAGPDLVDLGEGVTTALCAPEPPDAGDLASAGALHDRIVASVGDQLDHGTRVRSLLDPRPLVRR